VSLESRTWSLVARNEHLGNEYAYAVIQVGGGEGGLEHLEQPVRVGSRGSVLVMISTSGGMRTKAPEQVIDGALTEILNSLPAYESTAEESLSSLRRKLWSLFQAGTFCDAVPNGILVVASPSGLLGARFGPVGAAAVALDGTVLLLHDDERFSALDRAGVRLDAVFPHGPLVNPLVKNVSSLTNLDPTDASQLFRVEFSSYVRAVVLMSRGALPFTVQKTPTSPSMWAASEAGWMHGMPSVVVQVSRRNSTAEIESLHRLRAMYGIRDDA
jgi:hypothetical protein